MARVSFFFLVWLVYLLTIEQIKSEKIPLRLSNPSSTSTNWTEKISRECAEEGYCEQSEFFPEDLVRNISAMWEGTKAFFDNDDNDITPLLQARYGFDDSISPCEHKVKRIIPLIIKDFATDDWFYVVNLKENPIQLYYLQKCVKESGQGSKNSNGGQCKQLILHPDYESQCIQKYMTRKIVVIMDGKPVTKSWRMPCCCTCVAVKKL